MGKLQTINAWLICFSLLLISFFGWSTADLQVGFYQSTCPSVEQIVRNTVYKAVSDNPGLAAGLIRMHFHDCFVRGCDASVLLNSTSDSPAERDHPANNPSLRGFEVIDEAKDLIESACPNTVSCADILAFAARDSAYFTGGISYSVEAGRLDGRVSILDEVTQNLPPPTFNADQLIDNFAKKGLSADEMVTLSGAHSIGVTHCSSFSPRLFSFNDTHPEDPSLDPVHAAYLRSVCPPPSANETNPVVVLEQSTPAGLDNNYYVALTRRRGVLTSDQTLFDSNSTAQAVLNNAQYGSTWRQNFADAMVHMGSIEVVTGSDGEIRTICSVIN